MSHHVYPFLIGILFSALWSIILGTIEIFDSDMLIAFGYFAFAGRLLAFDNFLTCLLIDLLFISVLQVYLWVCAVSLYRDLLEIELDPSKPTRTTV